jgi:hypothetical protein
MWLLMKPDTSGRLIPLSHLFWNLCKGTMGPLPPPYMYMQGLEWVRIYLHAPTRFHSVVVRHMCEFIVSLIYINFYSKA